MSTTREEKAEELEKKAAPSGDDVSSEKKTAEAEGAREEEDDDDEEEEEEEETEAASSGVPKTVPSPSTTRGSAVIAIGNLPSPILNTLTIAKRELKAYFDSLVAYVVLGGSVLALGVWFFLYQGGFWQVDRATMARMFEFLPWALGVLVIPLVTMRALAEEKRSGTLELLITLPVRDAEVIIGKYLAAWGMCLILLATTLLYPIAMFKWPWHLGDLDWGPVWAAYFGLALFSAAGVAVGLLFSSYTESQIIAFFVTALVLLLMIVSGNLVEQTGGAAADVVAFLSFQSRYLPFARGLIDTRAVIYFVSVATLGLLISFRSLESRKWS